MTTKGLCFTVPGAPRGKGRPRFSRGGFAYTDKKTAAYESLVALAFTAAYPDWVPTEDPVEMQFMAYFPIAKSWSKKKKAEAIAGAIRPTGRPDTDNIAKVKDALNGIAYKDDAQVITEHIEKWYSDVPRLEIKIYCVEEKKRGFI